MESTNGFNTDTTFNLDDKIYSGYVLSLLAALFIIPAIVFAGFLSKVFASHLSKRIFLLPFFFFSFPGLTKC